MSRNILPHFTKGLCTLVAREAVPGNQHKIVPVLCSYLENPIYNCVHIVTPFRPVRRNFEQRVQKQWTAPEVAKTVCTQGPGAIFCARAQGLVLDLRSAPRGGRTCFCELYRICCSKRFNNVPVMETYK